MIVKMIKNLENKIEKLPESINKGLEELKNKHTETNNTITEIKNILKLSEMNSLSCVRRFATLSTVAYHVSQSMEFFRQEYWSGLPFLSPMHESEK